MKKSDVYKKFLADKKGVELTLNTVIIGILAVVVLIVIIAFFLGGTAKVKDTVSSIFGQTTAGQSIGLAVQNCDLYCEQAQGWSETLKKNSPYCTYAFKLDLDNDGEADSYTDEAGKKVVNSYYCKGSTLGVSCPGVEEQCTKEDKTE